MPKLKLKNDISVVKQAVDVDPLIKAGVVIGVHGLRGDLKIRPLSGEASSLDSTKEITLQSAAQKTLHQVEKVARHKGNLLFRLEGITSIELAEKLVGSDVFISPGDLKNLPDDEFYWFELEGLSVTDRRLGIIGKVVDIFTTPAHDILVVNGEHGEVLIPVVDAFILDIDTDGKTMQVNLPEGLVPEKNIDAL